MLWQRFSNAIITKTLTFAKGAVLKVTSALGVVTTLDLTELAALNNVSATDLAKIDGITNGTGAANKAVVLDANGGATIPGELALDGNTMAVGAGAGTLAGAALYKSSVVKVGSIIKTSILIDLEGLSSATSDLDVIGLGAGVAHIGQITAARNGTIIAGRVTCMEVPSSLTDIDLYSANEGTLVFEDGVVAIGTGEVALLTAGAAWTAALVRILTGFPVADQFLYLVNGAADTADPFTAGKFLIELYGYDA